MKIAIVTDSSADIPEDISLKNAITIVPMYVGYDGILYKEGMEISKDKVFNALESGKKVSTSAPSVGDFITVFKELIEEKKNDVVYYIGLSSRLSGSINSAFSAAKYFDSGKIKIFDSKTSTINLGLIAMEAARAVNRGLSGKPLDAIIKRLITDSSFTALLESMKYVFKGGRAAFLGKFLSAAIIFIPILTIGDNGKVKLQKFAKNLNSAFREIFRIAKKDSLRFYEKGYKKMHIGIFYGRDENQALKIKQMFDGDKELSRIKENIIITEITTIISAHTGPGLCGIAVCPKID
jgi:DegV family protein with EDD domain